MNFTAARFLFLFLPVFLLLYFLAQPRWRPVIGILASLIFYSWGDSKNLFLILGLIVINYWLGRFLLERPARWLLPVGLLINLGVLVFHKLFTAYRFDTFLGLQAYFPEWVTLWMESFTLPLGLSYISFQFISYLIDVYKGTVNPEKDLGNFAFYILMFPKLLVGPIIRYRTLREQLPGPQLDPVQFADGIRRFMGGFSKKILIADILAKTVNAVFDLPMERIRRWLAGWHYSALPCRCTLIFPDTAIWR
jgi:D-alanyl-lipoteichoic acid acyltransferase DltB (MBOAT superfamily)